ncbi:hypothetical protein PRIC2_012403 [Phytophthora ramorum]
MLNDSVQRLRELRPDTTKQIPVVNPATNPKKKRIRPQKLELDYLRGLVGKLERNMSELQVKQSAIDNKCIKTETTAPSIWKGIAERQQMDRVRAEEKNQRLRSTLEGQLKLAMTLEGLLSKRPREEELAVLAGNKRLKPVLDTAVSPPDDDIFADQLEHVLRAHLEVGELFGGSEFANPTASFCDLHVMNDALTDTGVAFVKKANSMLPFDVKVTGRAFWRALAEEGTSKDSYSLNERLKTGSLVSRSYAMHFDAGPFHANVLGKETYRRYVRDDCVMIMWKWVVDPVEVNGTKFSGLRCHETGWIVLRGVNIGEMCTAENELVAPKNAPRPVMSTLLQSYSRMTMELQDDIANQELQVGVLTNVVVNLHDALTEVCGKMMSNALVEEDWNLNGWVGKLSL